MLHVTAEASAARNSRSWVISGSSQARRVVASGPTWSLLPSVEYFPWKLLQPALPETCPSAKDSVMFDSPSTPTTAWRLLLKLVTFQFTPANCGGGSRRKRSVSPVAVVAESSSPSTV